MLNRPQDESHKCFTFMAGQGDTTKEVCAKIIYGAPSSMPGMWSGSMDFVTLLSLPVSLNKLFIFT